MRQRVLALATTAVVGLLAAACTTVVPVTPPPLPTERVLDGAALNSGVKSILENDYQIAVDDVTCPPDEQAAVGNSFTCTVTTTDGQRKQVRITVKTTDGQYEVGQPQ